LLLLSRRTILALACAIAACSSPRTSLLPGEAAARVTARPGRPLADAPVGWSELEPDPATGRGGRLYVPPSYSRDGPAPLVVLLHGAGQASRLWQNPRLEAWAGAIGAVILAPDSRQGTWDLIVSRGYGPDVTYLNDALRWTFARCNIHPDRIAIGGFSDGASVALSYGLANGDFFNAVLAFSPGFMDTQFNRGAPRVFVSHGTSDQILRFAYTSERIVPSLKGRGLTVEFMPFEGGHTIPPDIGDAAFRWFASRWR
jgi:predicted esterase